MIGGDDDDDDDVLLHSWCAWPLPDGTCHLCANTNTKIVHAIIVPSEKCNYSTSSELRHFI